LFELTEFFVLPAEQAKGVGRALLERAFPPGRGEVRSIIATTDVRALTRYYAAGVAARFPLLTVSRSPRPRAGDALPLEPIRIDSASARLLAEVSVMERSILDYSRGEDGLSWLLESREGYVYRRDGESVGFAFVGRDGAGPMGALDPEDQPALLRHVEGRAAALGADRLTLEVPGVNSVAMRYLMAEGFRLDPWVNLLMSSRPFGQFDRFIAFSPPTFL